MNEWSVCGRKLGMKNGGRETTQKQDGRWDGKVEIEMPSHDRESEDHHQRKECSGRPGEMTQLPWDEQRYSGGNMD